MQTRKALTEVPELIEDLNYNYTLPGVDRQNQQFN